MNGDVIFLQTLDDTNMCKPTGAAGRLNFTGSTPFTSRTGVKKEIFRYVPVMALLAGAGVILGIALGIGRLLGVI